MPLYALTPDLVDALNADYPHLTELDLSGNRLSSFDASELGALASSLHRLSLAHNRLSAVSLASLHSVSSLDLSHNALHDRRVLLQELRRLPHLRELSLAGNPLASGEPPLSLLVGEELPLLRTLDGQPCGLAAKLEESQLRCRTLENELTAAREHERQTASKLAASEAARIAAERRAERAEQSDAAAHKQLRLAEARAAAAQRTCDDALAATSAETLETAAGRGRHAHLLALLSRWRLCAQDALLQAVDSSERELAFERRRSAEAAALKAEVRSVCEALCGRCASLQAAVDARLIGMEGRVQACAAGVAALAGERDDARGALEAAAERCAAMHGRLKEQAELVQALREDVHAAQARRDDR